jgi:thiol-disulfide isomerase/thioredoxin
MFQEITDDSLQELIDNNDQVVVQYSAGWCGNCRIMKPKFKKMASEHEAIPFILIDAKKTLTQEN